MPPRSKKTTQPLGFEAQLWKAADALRNNMDASEYKHVVLGLIFLKYISDYFADAGDGDLVLENRDEYLAKNVFWAASPSTRRPGNVRSTARERHLCIQT
jgi:type I restriction enzyme M protein